MGEQKTVTPESIAAQACAESHGDRETIFSASPYDCALRAAQIALAAAPEQQPVAVKVRECECFGDSGLHASTYVPVGSDREHCDLCGYPVPQGSCDILSAPEPAPADELREENERLKALIASIAEKTVNNPAFMTVEAKDARGTVTIRFDTIRGAYRFQEGLADLRAALTGGGNEP